jgi:hypothetical protein
MLNVIKLSVIMLNVIMKNVLTPFRMVFYLCYKTSYLNEVNCTEPSPSVSVPWPNLR